MRIPTYFIAFMCWSLCHAAEFKRQVLPNHKKCPWFDEMVQCPGGAQAGCVMDYEMCNGIDNCPDGSDERGCRVISCDWDKQKCPGGRGCMREIDKCDGIKQCPDGSDEAVCPDEARMTAEENCTVMELQSGGYAENTAFFTKFYYAPQGSHYTSVTLMSEPPQGMSHNSKCENIGGLPGDKAYGINKYGNSVWITGDCKAKFTLCYHRYSAPHLGHERTDHKGCKNVWLHGYLARDWVFTLNMLKIDASGPIISMTLLEEAKTEEIHNRCRQDYSFGNQGRRMWVRLGCRGQFKVCSVKPESGDDDGLAVGRVVETTTAATSKTAACVQPSVGLLALALAAAVHGFNT